MRSQVYPKTLANLKIFFRQKICEAAPADSSEMRRANNCMKYATVMGAHSYLIAGFASL
jgi:hypothetical protein